MQPDPKKVLVILPDGVSLRNFVYSGFQEMAGESGFELVNWNATPLNLKKLGLKETPFDKNGIHWLTHSLKYAKTRTELAISFSRTANPIYHKYFYPPPLRNFKDKVKAKMADFFFWRYGSAKGLSKIRGLIHYWERRTKHYNAVKATLQRERPALVFCSNQRHLNTVSAILAAQDLGIPTAVFIFSWDNLPKAMLFVEADYYFVWSDHMKSELLYYYDHVKPEQIFVTGTPQFDPHGHNHGLLPREDFFAQYALDPKKKYICFSGDDVTTSPHDPTYLEDTAKAVRKLNATGQNLAVLFRRCPVDFSDRYDTILKSYSDVIFPLAPDWQKEGGSWGHVIPKAGDLVRQINTIAHSEMVINLGSSMVFDFAIFDKPCAFVNYNTKSDVNWSVEKVYSFIHFGSMPSKQAVLWLDSPEAISPTIQAVITGQTTTVSKAKEWLAKITRQPVGQASQSILDAFKQILDKR